MRRTRERFLPAWLLLAALLLLALSPTPASASPTCTQALIESKLACQFGTEGEGPGQFNGTSGVAVDNSGSLLDSSAGDVYAVDRNNSRVEKFSSAGEFLLAWGWGVVDGKAEAEVCGPTAPSPTESCLPGLHGAGGGEFEETSAIGVAVDSAPGSSSLGDVYVEDRRSQRIEKFSPDGEFLLAWGWGVVDGKAEAEVCGPKAPGASACEAGSEGPNAGEFEFSRKSNRVIAVDSAGRVDVADSGRVQVFSEDGALAATMKLEGVGGVQGLALDGAGDAYVFSPGEGVHEYEGCAVSCTAVELGKPRDPSAQEESSITVGPSEELLVGDTEDGRVLEFNGAGVQVASFGSAGESTGVAFGVGAGRLYVLKSVFAQLPLSPGGPGPFVEEEGAQASPEPPALATIRAVIDPEGAATEYHVVYQAEGGPVLETNPVPLGVEGFEPEPVEVKLTKLLPGAVYHYHFVVVNVNAPPGGNAGPVGVFTALPAVSVDGESVSQVTAASARVAGLVDPQGTETGYRFEYGRTAAYEQGSVPVPDAGAGAGIRDVPVEALLEGLEAAQQYHYRLVAHNTLGEAVGTDHTFTTQGSQAPGLIDGRAWEMVSPPQKHGASLEMSTEEGGLVQAAQDGGGLAYFAEAPIDERPAGSRSFAYSQLLSKREGGAGSPSWSTQDITTPNEAVEIINKLSEYKLFSSDLSVGLVEPEGATPLGVHADEPNPERTPYLRSEAGFQPLMPAAGLAPGVKYGGTQGAGGEGKGFAFGTEFATATPDLSHVLLASTVALTKGFESHGLESVYEWSAGALKLVSILPNEVPTAEEGQRAAVGDANELVRNAISADGSRVVFAAGSEGKDRHLYLRDVGVGRSAQLDVVQPGVVNPGGSEPKFVDASSDDSRVFFLDGQRLTADSSATESVPDLYMCEVPVPSPGGQLECNLKDLSVPVNAQEHANVRGTMIGSDQAGRYVYFVADGVLAADAVAGERNLYVHDTQSGVTRLVAVLSSADSPDWNASGEERTDLGEVAARVSPDGQYLAFMSQQSLTGYDNLDARSGHPDEEVFVYHAAEGLGRAGTLTCVSCNPSGGRPDGVFDPLYALRPHHLPLLVDRPDVWANHWLAGSIPEWTRVDLTHALYQPRYLNNAGRVFFDSSDALVPRDSNGREDVYEYEPAGAGGCPAGPAGCVGLISSGTSGGESAFMDASGKGPGGEEGEDVFFMTSAKLAPQDVDSALDVYDAHVCSTAAPCAPSITDVPPACGTTDSCRAAPAPQPDIFGAPAGATLDGPGNITPQAPPPPKHKTAAQERAEKLSKALKACRKKKNKHNHKACEAQARKRYGPAKAKKASHITTTHKGGT